MSDFPQILEDLTRYATDLRVPGDLVLIETNPREGMVGSLFVPIAALEAYPTSGWVFALGPNVQEDLSVGDFVLVEEEGLAVDSSYYDVFEITLRHDGGLVETIFADIEVEPVVRERMNTYRRGGEDLILSMVDRKVGGSISFNCSNVMDWQIGQIANPQYDVTYIPVSMFTFLNEDGQPTLYYITRESRILLSMEYDVERADSPLQPDPDQAETAHSPH